MPESFGRILVARTDRLGDVILSLPVLRELKRNFPSAHLAMLVSPYTKPVVETNPYLDEVIVYDPEAHRGWRGIRRLAEQIKFKKFDLAIALFPRWTISWLMFLSGIPVRVGSGYRPYFFFFNRRIWIHRSTIEKHEAEYNLDWLGAVGIKPGTPEITLELTKDDRLFSDRFLSEKINPVDNLLAVHPGSSGSALNWPAENYAEMADSLIDSGNQVILTGSLDEKELLEQVSSKMRNKPIIPDRQFTIRQFAALIKSCRVFVSASTGPMHLAAAVKTPTVSLSSPLFTASEKRWGPLGNRSVVLKPALLPCKKCSMEKCREYNCMKKISVPEAVKAVEKLLSEAKK